MTFAALPVVVRRMAVKHDLVGWCEIDLRCLCHRERLAIFVVLNGGLIGLRVGIRNAIEKKLQPLLFAGSFTGGNEREANEGEKNNPDDPLRKTRNAKRRTRKSFSNLAFCLFLSEFRVPCSAFQWSVH